MRFRIGILVAVSIGAYAIRQLTIRTWNFSTLPTNCSENREAKEKDGEEEQKVNSKNYDINRINDSLSDLEGEDRLSEFSDDLSRESEHSLLDDNKKEEKVQLDILLKLVMELEQRKVKLEDELLMYHGLKDGKPSITELQTELNIKNGEVDMLNSTISTLQTDRKKLQEEIVQGALMKKELEVARSKIKELLWQLQLDENQTKQYLLLLKQRVSRLQSKEEEAVKKEAEIHKEMEAVKSLEVELKDLKTKNRELQHEKKELTIKLDGMQARIRNLTSMIESEMVVNEEEEAHKLRCANEDLMKQIEGLQMNRFNEVEELVYLRWVNACFRYELRNDQATAGEVSVRDLFKRPLSPKSKENAKQLMLDYAKLDFGEADTDPESKFALPFYPGIEAFDNTSNDSSTSRRSSLSVEHYLNPNLKKWSRSKDDSSAVRNVV